MLRDWACNLRFRLNWCIANCGTEAPNQPDGVIRLDVQHLSRMRCSWDLPSIEAYGRMLEKQYLQKEEH